MTWYSAHAILYVRYKSGNQDTYSVWENIYLISGDNYNQALDITRQRAEEDAGDSNGTFTWNGHPSEWVFAGIRKLIKVAHNSLTEEPSNGDEISYSEFELPNLNAVMELANGESVRLEYIE